MDKPKTRKSEEYCVIHFGHPTVFYCLAHYAAVPFFVPFPFPFPFPTQSTGFQLPSPKAAPVYTAPPAASTPAPIPIFFWMLCLSAAFSLARTTDGRSLGAGGRKAWSIDVLWALEGLPANGDRDRLV